MNSLEDNDLLHYLEWEAEVQGSGREHIENHGKVLHTHTHQGVTFEIIETPSGYYRRVIKNNILLRLTRLPARPRIQKR